MFALKNVIEIFSFDLIKIIFSSLSKLSAFFDICGISCARKCQVREINWIDGLNWPNTEHKSNSLR